jgi:hypothetical protein
MQQMVFGDVTYKITTAILNENVDSFKKSLDFESNVMNMSQFAYYHNRLLCMMINYNRYQMFKYYINKYKNLQLDEVIGYHRGNFKFVKALLKYGVNINVKSMYGCSLLMDATIKGSIDIVKFLLKNGARIDQRCTVTTHRHIHPVREFKPFRSKELGRTALWFAVNMGNLKLVKYLIKMGANADDTLYEAQLLTYNDIGNKEIVHTLAAIQIQKRFRYNREVARSSFKIERAFRGKLPHGPASIIASFLHGPIVNRCRYQSRITLYL